MNLLQKGPSSLQLSHKAGHVLALTREGMGLSRAKAASKLRINVYTLRSAELRPGACKVSLLLRILALYHLQLKDLCK